LLVWRWCVPYCGLRTPLSPKILGDQFKPNDAIQAEPADVIHGRDIAGDSLASGILRATILLVEELGKRTRHLILFRLKAVRLCLVDDLVGIEKAQLVGDFREEQVKVGFHCFCVLGLLLLFSVILFLQFLGKMSIVDFDIFCRPVCRDHFTDAVAAHLCHAASDSPVAFGFLVCFNLSLNGKDQIGANVADIGEVQCGVLIFHGMIMRVKG